MTARMIAKRRGRLEEVLKCKFNCKNVNNYICLFILKVYIHCYFIIFKNLKLLKFEFIFN